ncbi:hypothetical protein [Bacillus massilinigeriensis]|uniref:hypothetical protein n=1 Tax=Bacillus massilionigeriensis TaxID=1805475 RepID=UPI00096AFD8F|nr:hypothetical protein [Bacillus massilionigeriensis]
MVGHCTCPFVPKDPILFEDVRRSTILSKIQEDIQFYINRHNTYSKKYGITYTFTLPILSKEDWDNTIDDIGMISFIQGYPLAGNETYNNFALGGSRISKVHQYFGTVINGTKYYFRDDADYSYSVEEIFTTPKEAVKKGYLPITQSNRDHFTHN